jgi:hypothetical protein
MKSSSTASADGGGVQLRTRRSGTSRDRLPRSASSASAQGLPELARELATRLRSPWGWTPTGLFWDRRSPLGPFSFWLPAGRRPPSEARASRLSGRGHDLVRQVMVLSRCAACSREVLCPGFAAAFSSPSAGLAQGVWVRVAVQRAQAWTASAPRRSRRMPQSTTRLLPGAPVHSSTRSGGAVSGIGRFRERPARVRAARCDAGLGRLVDAGRAGRGLTVALSGSASPPMLDHPMRVGLGPGAPPAHVCRVLPNRACRQAVAKSNVARTC